MTSVIYCSIHGHAKKASSFFSYQVFNINEKIDYNADTFVIICPTYGDEELPLEMEDFLLNLQIRNKNYYICELGNLFEQEEFGAAPIIRYCLSKLGWVELGSISIDSTPVLDVVKLKSWISDVLPKT